MTSIKSTTTESIRKKLTITEKNKFLRESDKLVVYPKWCKGCGICWQLCPTETLGKGKDGKAYITNPEKCTACRICEIHCPDFAIVVVGKKGKKK